MASRPHLPRPPYLPRPSPHSLRSLLGLYASPCSLPSFIDSTTSRQITRIPSSFLYFLLLSFLSLLPLRSDACYFSSCSRSRSDRSSYLDDEAEVSFPLVVVVVVESVVPRLLHTCLRGRRMHACTRQIRHFLTLRFLCAVTGDGAAAGWAEPWFPSLPMSYIYSIYIPLLVTCFPLAFFDFGFSFFILFLFYPTCLCFLVLYHSSLLTVTVTHFS
ncbi:hypothetical protein R3P38DRAFT_2844456, partial [Favolaschia claudopus]